MEYSKLVAVTGLPGLFELINSKTDGAIVRSLDDKSTRFVSTRIHNFSHLESIEIYTVRDNVNMVDLFTAMEKATDDLPDEKDAAAVQQYFEKVFPDMDFERVYASDMKKMVKWFAALKKHDVEIKLSEIPEEEVIEEEKDESVGEEKKSTKKPKEINTDAEKEVTGSVEKPVRSEGGKKAAPKEESRKPTSKKK